jgi:hypothetical protein
MKKLFNLLFKNKKEEVIEPTTDKGKCTTCIFADYENDYCTVGTHYAEKGLLKTCYEGELWETNKQ